MIRWLMKDPPAGPAVGRNRRAPRRRRAVEAEFVVASAIFGNLMAQPKRGIYTPPFVLAMLSCSKSKAGK